MNQDEIIKKKRLLKPGSKSITRNKPKSMFPTLARIVLSNGSQVEIPKLPLNGSQLTTYDNMRIALEHAAILLSNVRERDYGSVPKLMLSSDWDVIRLNLEDLMNHLYYAIEGFHSSKESS